MAEPTEVPVLGSSVRWSGSEAPPRSHVFKESCGLVRCLACISRRPPYGDKRGGRPHPLTLRPPPQQAAEHLKSEKDHPNAGANPQAPLSEPEAFSFNQLPHQTDKSWEFSSRQQFFRIL